jgi:hypothetical protein
MILGLPTNPNFYDNCVAFAAGADAYREAVRTATPASPPAEWQLREWLRTTGIGFQSDSQWVYEDPIGLRWTSWPRVPGPQPS